ncbi:MAG: PIN domain-containing protein [Lachnospiraceae bacterium]|jgi:PIN domain nuclease of toxin-antitoxin system|nr:PIN domain-containing protein [Lachnospiraceae bacterium]
MTRYVLDACALIALIYDEDGANVVAEEFNLANDGKVELRMHKANLLEVYYYCWRTNGKPKADWFWSELLKRPVSITSENSDELFEEAARLKSLYKVSFADTFALAETSVSGGILLTADHHEMDAVERDEPGICFKWIR